MQSGTEVLSKNEQKRRAKQAEKERIAAEKAAAKAAAAADAPAKPKKDAGPVLEEEDEDIDPTKYFDNRLNWVNGLKSSGKNPYPHKFQTTMQLPQYHAAYCGIEPGGFSESIESLAGRIMSKRAGGKGLVFYDIHADGLKLQIFCSHANFSAFQGEDGLSQFMALMNSTKRGDLIGVTGRPGKTKRGELSIFPTDMHILTPW